MSQEEKDRQLQSISEELMTNKVRLANAEQSVSTYLDRLSELQERLAQLLTVEVDG
jgi:ribosomal protein L29